MTDMHLGNIDGFDIIVTDEAVISSTRFPPHLYDITVLRDEFAAFCSKTEHKIYVHPDIAKKSITLTKD